MTQSKPKTKLVFRASSPALKIAVTVLIVFSMAALVAMAWVRTEIRSRVDALQQEAITLIEDNHTLQEKTNNLGSVQSVVDIAREELGLVDPNTVVIQPEEQP